MSVRSAGGSGRWYSQLTVVLDRGGESSIGCDPRSDSVLVDSTCSLSVKHCHQNQSNVRCQQGEKVDEVLGPKNAHNLRPDRLYFTDRVQREAGAEWNLDAQAVAGCYARRDGLARNLAWG